MGVGHLHTEYECVYVLYVLLHLQTTERDPTPYISYIHTMCFIGTENLCTFSLPLVCHVRKLYVEPLSFERYDYI